MSLEQDALLEVFLFPKVCKGVPGPRTTNGKMDA